MPIPRQCLFPAVAPPPDMIQDLVIDGNVTRYTRYNPATKTAILSVGVAWRIHEASLRSLRGYETRLVEIEAEGEGGSMGEEFARVVVMVSYHIRLRRHVIYTIAHNKWKNLRVVCTFQYFQEVLLSLVSHSCFLVWLFTYYSIKFSQFVCIQMDSYSVMKGQHTAGKCVQF